MTVPTVTGNPVPDTSGRESSRTMRPIERELLALAVAVGGPLACSLVISDSRPGLILTVGLAATALLVAIPERAWLWRISVAVVAAAVVWAPEGRLMALWIAAGIGLSDWVVRRRRPLPFVPAAGRGSLAPVLVLLTMAALRGRSPDPGLESVVFVGLAVVVTLIGALSGGRLDRFTAAAGRSIAAGLSQVLFTLLGLLLIPIPWAAGRVFRTDSGGGTPTRRLGATKRSPGRRGALVGTGVRS